MPSYYLVMERTVRARIPSGGRPELFDAVYIIESSMLVASDITQNAREQ
jgi:hypothetical protein